MYSVALPCLTTKSIPCLHQQSPSSPLCSPSEPQWRQITWRRISAAASQSSGTGRFRQTGLVSKRWPPSSDRQPSVNRCSDDHCYRSPAGRQMLECKMSGPPEQCDSGPVYIAIAAERQESSTSAAAFSFVSLNSSANFTATRQISRVNFWT